MAALSGATVIVSGAGSGIGLATALAAADRGANVGMLDRDGRAVRAVAGDRDDLLPIECDVTDRAQVDMAVAAVAERFGAVRGLVTSAGVDHGGPSHLVSAGEWRRTLEVNLTGTFLLCQKFLGSTGQHREGQASIVCLSSPAAFVGFSAGENAAYSASKGGVSALVRTLAVEYAAAGVRVNAVVPGATETPLMWANVDDADRDAVRGEVERSIPLGRLARPDEIAEAVVWLLGDSARYVTGTHLVCDGGLLAKAAIAV